MIEDESSVVMVPYIKNSSLELVLNSFLQEKFFDNFSDESKEVMKQLEVEFLVEKPREYVAQLPPNSEKKVKSKDPILHGQVMTRRGKRLQVERRSDGKFRTNRIKQEPRRREMLKKEMVAMKPCKILCERIKVEDYLDVGLACLTDENNDEHIIDDVKVIELSLIHI